MKTLLGIFVSLVLLFPSWALAVTGILSQAANPPQPVIVLSQSAIPFIKASSGTMGNNGAVSAMTALPRTFSGGAWLWLPAGAVAAGVPASATWYWFVGSSTTAGTVYNSTYTSGTPTIGTTTAFSTTGPGAFVGSTATITGPSIVLPANLMGANGQTVVRMTTERNTTGGNKSQDITFGANQCQNITWGAIASVQDICILANRGLTNKSNMSDSYVTSGSVAALFVGVDTTIDTTANVTITLNMSTAAATDHIIVTHYNILIYPGY